MYFQEDSLFNEVKQLKTFLKNTSTHKDKIQIYNSLNYSLYPKTGMLRLMPAAT